MSEAPSPTPPPCAGEGLQQHGVSPSPAHRERGSGGEGSLVLVTGGARSGKSRYAEQLALAGRQPVLYVATAEAGDDEMRDRIRVHQQRRPADWSTLEARTDVGKALASLPVQPGTVLLDDMGLLVTNNLIDVCGDDDPNTEQSSFLDVLIEREIEALEEARAAAGWDSIVVTNEVGLGIVPATPLGRVFRDALGRANQLLAARADAVYLLVAGLPLRIKPGCEHLAGGSI